MRKLTALLLALLVVFSMSASAFAVDGSGGTNNSGETEVTFTKKAPDPEPQDPYADLTYTISIPRSVTLDSNANGSFDVALAASENLTNKRILVKLNEDSADTYKRFYIYADKGAANESRIPLQLKKGNSEIGQNDTVAIFSDYNPSSVTLSIIPFGSYNIADASPGDYSGTLRFDISVGDL